MKEVIIFKVPTPNSEDDVNAIDNFRLKLEDKYKDTNQVPLVITDDIEVIIDVKKNSNK
jgi:hypothetical protein